MSDDLLKTAARALREESTGEPPIGDRTRARILHGLHERRRKRRTGFALGIPLAAVFAGSTAWAGASGKLGRWVDEIVAVVSAPEEGAELATASTASTPFPAKSLSTPPQASSPEPSEAPDQESTSVDEAPERVVPEAAPPEPRPASVPVAAPRHSDAPSSTSTDRAKAPVRVNDVTPSAKDDEVEDEAPPELDTLALYRKAHRLHFDGGDPGAAIRAYDKYLRLAPGGTFATEARYNRALLLLRLGERSAAIAALTPFAEGRYGGYRQSDAQALIDAASK